MDMVKEIQEDLREDEATSDHALVIVEAIYKLIRRNTQLQHIDVSNCQLQ